MIIEQYCNGKIELRLTPQNAIEEAFLVAIAQRAEKGQAVTVKGGENSTMRISVEQ